ncbi:MAG TPA: hypothetical protein VHB20_17470 [Verrucomicrobiae bacterium]|jgi:hypothetical protein|nr:hypothetical protein [Verrucomicrobiae bacterium]
MEFSTPKSFTDWLLCLAAFMAILKYLMDFSDRVRGASPEPPNAQLQASHQQLAERVRKLEESTDRLWAKLESDKMEIMKSGEDRALKLHERINAILAAVSELRGRMETPK